MANTATKIEETFTTDYNHQSEFMDKIRKEVIINYSPQLSKDIYDAIRTKAEEMAERAGEERGTFEIISDLHRELDVNVKLPNCSFRQAQVIAEPWRMDNPTSFANIKDENSNCWIGNVTWGDQMEMFWGYETYTEAGHAASFARNEEAKAKGINGPSWE